MRRRRSRRCVDVGGRAARDGLDAPARSSSPVREHVARAHLDEERIREPRRRGVATSSVQRTGDGELLEQQALARRAASVTGSALTFA